MTIRVRTERAPTNTEGKLKVAQLPFIAANDSAALKAEAAKLGFKEVAPDQFVHKDGSWAMLSNGRLERGVKGTRFTSIPQPYVPPPKPMKGAPKLSEARPRVGQTWDWFTKNTALGKAPIINDAATGKRELTKLGFMLSTHDKQSGEQTWVHPDGSWFKLNDQYGGVSCGFKGYELGELPFQR